MIYRIFLLVKKQNWIISLFKKKKKQICKNEIQTEMVSELGL